MLVHNKIKPYLVFDGGYLPSKAGKEDEREAKRNSSKSKGMAFLRGGNRSQAMDCFQKCIDITPAMALKLIECCKKANIDYVVAPYEADAQLAFLSKHGLCDAVITEDSDLLVFGCKRLIYKMDAFGNGQEVRLEYIHADLSPSKINLHNWYVAPPLVQTRVKPTTCMSFRCTFPLRCFRAQGCICGCCRVPPLPLISSPLLLSFYCTSFSSSVLMRCDGSIHGRIYPPYRMLRTAGHSTSSGKCASWPAAIICRRLAA